ncbi:MAG: hypothetical protein ABEJ00_01195 [Gemmatimonadota bacterium]
MKLRSMVSGVAVLAAGLVLAAEGAAQQADPAIRLATASRTDVESMAVSGAELEWWDVQSMPGVQVTYLLADRTRAETAIQVRGVGRFDRSWMVARK